MKDNRVRGFCVHNMPKNEVALIIHSYEYNKSLSVDENIKVLISHKMDHPECEKKLINKIRNKQE